VIDNRVEFIERAFIEGVHRRVGDRHDCNAQGARSRCNRRAAITGNRRTLLNRIPS
jgi:hypothetical protein